MRTDLRLSREETEQLLQRYAETRDVAARDRLVEGHLYIAEIIARKFSGRGVDYDDLFQVAALALTRCVDRFDPARSVRFSTYVTPVMVGEVKNYFRDRYLSIRTPRRSAERIRQIELAVDALTQELHRPPRAEEIAARSGLREDEVLEGLEIAGLQNVSLSVEPTEGERPIADTLGEEDEGYAHIENVDQLRGPLARLTPRQREVIEMRFFQNLSQREIARRIGTSQMSISRAERAALALLRQELAPQREET